MTAPKNMPQCETCKHFQPHSPDHSGWCQSQKFLRFTRADDGCAEHQPHPEPEPPHETL